MDVYMYQADLYCADCGAAIRAELDRAGKAPADPSNESSYDSGDYPKGPYPDGGGEADTPQYCGECGEFLENPLTAHGVAYVQAAVADYLQSGRGRGEVIRAWVDAYDVTLSTLLDAADEMVREREITERARALRADTEG